MRERIDAATFVRDVIMCRQPISAKLTVHCLGTVASNSMNQLAACARGVEGLDVVYIASANPASRTELRFSSALMGNILSLCLRMARATEDNTAALRELSSQVQSLSLKVVALQSQLAEMSKGHESRYVILGKMTLDDEGRRHLEIAITTSTDCRQDLQTLVSAKAKNSVPASIGSKGSGKAVTPSPSPGKGASTSGAANIGVAQVVQSPARSPVPLVGSCSRRPAGPSKEATSCTVGRLASLIIASHRLISKLSILFMPPNRHSLVRNGFLLPTQQSL